MNDSSKVNPREMYKGRMAARQAETAACQRQHLLLGYVRLVLVIAAAAVAWFSLYQHLMSPWWLLAPFAMFVVAARRHSWQCCNRSWSKHSGAIAYFEREHCKDR